MSGIIYVNKLVSKILRHEIEMYDINYNGDGWIKLDDLLDILNGVYGCNNLSQSDIHSLITAFDKQRFEIKGDMIRALYGHSLKDKITKEIIQPPDILFHGTIEKNLHSILKNGLICGNRQYVHLAVNEIIAFQVANRRKGTVVVLKINSKKAYNSGVDFFKGNDKVILSEHIPSMFIEILNN